MTWWGSVTVSRATYVLVLCVCETDMGGITTGRGGGGGDEWWITMETMWGREEDKKKVST